MDCRARRHGALRCHEFDAALRPDRRDRRSALRARGGPSRFSSCGYTKIQRSSGDHCSPAVFSNSGVKRGSAIRLQSPPERGITQSAGSASPGNLWCPTSCFPSFDTRPNATSRRRVSPVSGSRRSVHPAHVADVAVEDEVLPIRRPATGPELRFAITDLHQGSATTIHRDQDRKLPYAGIAYVHELAPVGRAPVRLDVDGKGVKVPDLARDRIDEVGRPQLYRAGDDAPQSARPVTRRSSPSRRRRTARPSTRSSCRRPRS